MPAVEAADELTVDLLPARHGDAILLSWGPADARHRMLVDGGPAVAYRAVAPRLAELLGSDPLDLVVLTHIDGDHIEGLILLTNDAELDVEVKEIWFNGSGMLTKELGAVQGEILAALIRTRGIPWNVHTKGEAVARDDDGSFRTIALDGGLNLTVLGPDRPTLRRLRDDWEKVCRDARLTFGSVEEALAILHKRTNLRPPSGYLGEAAVPNVLDLAGQVFAKDGSLANSSSIVLLAEYGDARVLLAGDATPRVLVPAVRALLEQREITRLPLSAFKLPHHGSARNVTKELLSLLPADRYLFSSDGSQFGHPDDTAVARVLSHGSPGAELIFNYRNEQTRKWADARLAARGYRFLARYPDSDNHGVRVAVPSSATHAAGNAAAQTAAPAEPAAVPGNRDAAEGSLRTRQRAAPSGAHRSLRIAADTPQRRRTRPAAVETVTITVSRSGTVGVASSAGGGVSNGKLDDDRLDELLIRQFERRLAQRERSWAEAELRAFGMLLFRHLFSLSKDVWSYLQNKLDERRDEPLRIRLAFPDRDGIAALPWEYLHTPQSSGREGFFLAGSPSLVLARYVPPTFETPPFSPQRTLRLLPVVANPDPYGLGDVDYEPALSVIEGVDPASGIEVLPAQIDASPTSLSRAVAAYQPDVIHYVGHGRFDPEDGVGSIALQDPTGGPAWLSESELVARLQRGGAVPRIVVLHTCEGGRPDFEDRFAGLGPALLRSGVQYVAAMQYAVPNEVATTFTEHLYELLGQRVPVDLAVHRCRFALADVSNDPRILGFPVLYESDTVPVLR